MAKRYFILVSMVLCWVALAEPSTKLALDFENIKVRSLLTILAHYLHKNILISDNITTTMSVHLPNVTAANALEYVVQMQGLQKHEVDNTLFITAGTTQGAVNLLDLQYASADELATLLGKQPMLATDETVIADKRMNKLLVQAAPAKVAALKNIVNLIDLPIRQVVIKAKIVSADTNFSRELGLQFGTVNTNRSGNIQMDLPQAIDTDHFTFTIAKLSDNKLLDLELAALESEGRGKIISSPKLVTLDRKVAYIESGAEIPYQEKAARGATNVAFKKAALSLKVTPEITAHNLVTLHIQVSQDKISETTINGVPAIDTRRIETQVAIKDGTTIVLGGIYEWGKVNKRVGIPVLGKVPILGRLFSQQIVKSERKELLIFVTPTILKTSA